MDVPASRRPLVFGIYPGGAAGSDEGELNGAPDDPPRIEEALRLLQGPVEPFVVRVYERYSDADNPSRWSRRSPADYARYAMRGRQLDIVSMFQSARGDVEGYLEWVRALVREHGTRLYSIQVTEEANFTSGPDAIDGPYPRVREALVRGVRAAKDEVARGGFRAKVGFNSTPTFGAGSVFWSALGEMGGAGFPGDIDYVGIDFFPDVFAPVAEDGKPGDLWRSVILVLETMRSEWLPAAGIPSSMPIHITEHGWPTGPERLESRQAEVVETAVRAVAEVSARLNVARYTMFDLRDASSSQSDMMFRFGLMRDDYTPKPAFETYRKLIAELGR